MTVPTSPKDRFMALPDSSVYHVVKPLGRRWTACGLYVDATAPTAESVGRWRTERRLCKVCASTKWRDAP